MPKPRKHTRFQFCANHSWLNEERRYRRAEFAAEGGPGTPCSDDEPCKVYAGTDYFIPEVCTGEYVSQFGHWH